VLLRVDAARGTGEAVVPAAGQNVSFSLPRHMLSSLPVPSFARLQLLPGNKFSFLRKI
jgi:hypothetical protein